MISWYKNDRIEIIFDDIPLVAIRYFVPSMSKEEKKSIEKYPFVCKKELSVCLKNYKKNKLYKFKIPKGYCFDGASIPRLFWRIIGAKTDNKFLVPALIHDILCEHHEYIENDKSFSTEVFNALLESNSVPAFKRFLMKNSVACFQTIFCNW